jgi:DNA recombination protein RmuC
MFMPIESAYMLALQSDRELHSFAWDKGVAIVCPSTLFSSLRTISSLWRLVLQNQNAIEIAQKGGALYDKVVGFVGDMQVIGNNLKTLDGNYHKALNKLSEGRGSVLSRTQNLKELGAKASKSLPSELLHDDLENPILEESTLIDLKNKNSSKVA